jgi:type IV secretory pathway component VirB8
VWVITSFKLKNSVFNANSYTQKKKSEGKTPTGLYKSGENWATNMLRHLESQPFTLQRSVSFGAAGLSSVVAVIVVMGVMMVG